MHDICNLFGVALNRARHELGLTQVELAEKLGTTDRSISDLERGKTNPKLDTVAHFSRSLGISIDALVGIVPKGDVPSCVRTFFAGMSAEEAAILSHCKKWSTSSGVRSSMESFSILIPSTSWQ